MENVLFPDIFGNGVKAFFTGKTPGTEPGRIAEVASIERQKIYMPVQKHTDKVLILDSFEPRVADAVITNERGVLIGVQVADCLPILLYDTKRHVIGAVHAGWRGTAEGVLKKTITAIIDKFYSSLSDIMVAFGPSIRWCCYNVGYEVVGAVRKATGHGDYYMTRGEKYCLDLQTANRLQALTVGISEKNIWLSDECTFCLPDKYYSYRYAKGTTGRQGGFIGMV